MDCVQLIMMIATLATVIIAAYALWVTIEQFKKQLQLNFFAEYTKRYQEIVLNFPEDINDEDFDFNDLDKDLKDKTLRYMRSYFDLCSEEYFLHKRSHLDTETWKEWSSGIEYAFSKKAFQKGWKIISLDTKYYSDFAKLVDIYIKKAQK